MKRLLFFAVTLFCFSTNLACQDIEKKVYCCDPTINRGIVDNLSSIRKMDRSQWLKLKEDYKIPAYRAFTPEQKHELWKGKFKELKTLPWTKAELEHINKAIKWVERHPFLWSNRKSTDEELNELDLFFTKWTIEAEEKLNWDKQVAIALFQTPDRVLDTKGTLEITKTGLILKPISKASIEDPGLEVDTTDIDFPSDTTDIDNPDKAIKCHCTDQVFFDGCGTNTCDSHWIKCEIVEKGCGWMDRYDCNGLCITP